MRWEALFADLEGELAAQRWDEIESTAAELTRGDRAQIALGQRLRAALGRQIRLSLSHGEALSITLESAAPQWLGGYDSAGSLIVATHAIEAIDADLSRAEMPEEKRPLGASMATVCRALSRRRESVVVTSVSGRVLGEGRIELVGADYLEMGRSADVERRSRIATRRAIPFAAIQTVRAHRMALD